MTGKELQKAIVDLGRTLGWRVAHFPPVNTTNGWRVPVAADGKGWPDLFLLRERPLVVEVKGTKDYLKPEQETWLTAFRIAGIQAEVWTPEDWGPEGTIETELKRRHRIWPARAA